MPQVIFTSNAMNGLERCRKSLLDKDPLIAVYVLAFKHQKEARYK